MQRNSAVSLRAVCTGGALCAAISVLSPWAALLHKSSELTSNAIPVIAVVSLFVLTAVVAPVMRALSPRLAFTRPELLVIYVMMLIAAVIPTKGLMGSFLGVITGPLYYSTPENGWAQLFLPHVNQWLAPKDLTAVRYLYEGLPDGMGIPWAAWAVPLLAWGAFLLAFYWSLLCLGAILQGQWLDRERLVFPLTKLPLAMTEEEPSGRLAGVFHSRLMWLGFSVPLLLHSWNSLDNYSDAFPAVTLNTTLGLLNGQVAIPIHLNFPVIGLGYLMQLNVSFSVWFFYMLSVLQRWAFARLGVQIGGADVWNSGLTPPSIMHQQAGGLLVLTLFVLWTSRDHVREIVRRARAGGAARAGEPLPPRTAVVGLVIGVVFMLSWLVQTGMSLWVAALLVGGTMLVLVGLARIVGEAGMPSCQTPMVPQAFIMRGIGAENLGMNNVTGLGMSTTWMGETSANMMVAIVHSLRLVHGVEGTSGRLVWAMGLAVVIALAGSCWTVMYLAHAYGGINLADWYFGGAPRWPFEYAASVVRSPEASFAPRLAFTAIGSTIMGGLLYMRHHFLWWPLHPIGFPIAAPFQFT
ncbi:MAG: hypothetical protein HOH74_06545, partial [Gemmatimonadetes bacterium]|nr:hypothetical protein [Gemmatimonadota bacterium]